MKNVKIMIFFMSVGFAVAMTILFFDYSIAVEIKRYFQPSIHPYAVPIWLSIASAIFINLIGACMALPVIKGLKTMLKEGQQQTLHQNMTS